MNFKNTSLWKKAFNNQENDPNKEARELLRSTLSKMRENVAQLVAQIPTDCKDLTIHDITHLDALWGSAEVISGENWDMNPAEAFVFGAAILIHDAGLTTLSYPDGKAGLRQLDLWKDIAAAHQKEEEVDEATEEVENAIVFAVLRELHADQAEKLCKQSWKLNTGDQLYLLEDSELREAFGESIGRIAGSHHWSIDRIADELSENMGSSPKLPAEWTINEKKLACLLRCSDAAQVDRTRSPLLLYAALNPTGYSNLHWQSQSKLNRPVLVGDAITFASSSKFNSDMAEAWWIAFDLASILDRELRNSNALLNDSGLVSFGAKRVAGIDTPVNFSEFVKTNKWRPIDTSIRVTDPLKIAKVLGGKSLYGKNPIVPLRELIQNAADAIRARRVLENRDITFGKINITLEKAEEPNSDILIHISDNGIGMSERVLSTKLVDFGSSFWTSDLLKEEFPSLRSKGHKPIGKFGIGFFSIFDIATRVSVSSRRFDAGTNDFRTLDFKGLVMRPLLLAQTETNISTDVSTQVTLSLKEGTFNNGLNDNEDGTKINLPSEKHGKETENLKQTLMRMVSFLDIQVNFTDVTTGGSFKHSPSIYDTKAETFLDELFPDSSESGITDYQAANRLRSLVDAEGRSYGRAALNVKNILSYGSRSKPHLGEVAVGGIVDVNRHHDNLALNEFAVPYIGVVEGDTKKAARDFSSHIVPEGVIETWLQEQLSCIDMTELQASEKLELGCFAYERLGSKIDTDFAFHCKSIISLKSFKEVFRDKTRILIPISEAYGSTIKIIGYSELTSRYFDAPLSEEAAVFVGQSRFQESIKIEGEVDRGVDQDYKIIGNILESKKWRFGSVLHNVLTELWEAELRVKVVREAIFETPIASLKTHQLCLEISR